MNLRSGSADPSVPTEAPSGEASTSGAGKGFSCEFPGCNRVFAKKTGRGVHYNSAHKDWYDARSLEKVDKKARWSFEEKQLLARKEAELILRNEREGKDVRFMNQLLMESFGDRTIEGIKGIRRRLSHKSRVDKYLTDLRQQNLEHQNSDEDDDDANSLPPKDTTTGSVNNEKLFEYMESLEPFNDRRFNTGRLNNICSEARRMSGEDLLLAVAMYLRETFPISKKGRRQEEDVSPPLSKRQQRRADYAKVQDLWKKDRGRCWKSVDSEQLHKNYVVPESEMVPYWKAIMSRNTGLVPNLQKADRVLDLWKPVLFAEVKMAFPSRKTAPGPDGMTARILRSIPIAILVRIFTIFQICRRVPDYLLESRTTLIPKKKGSTDPCDFRPITVAPVIIRTYHKVWANRLKAVELDERQRAFRSTDGCSDNIFLLDLALRYHRQKHKQMFLASTDIAKAYDSVTFEALEEVMYAKGFPPELIEYIMSVYEASRTRLEHGGWSSELLHPTCGVKQGDPMSCVLFNCVIDVMLSNIPDDIGIKVSNMPINILAFADDLILMAESKVGLQELLNISADFLYTTGLEVNAGKCCSIAIKSIPKEKKVAIDKGITFKIRGKSIPALKRTDEWKYLGVPFTPEGRLMTNMRELLAGKIGRLSKAPLKPQQRIWVLVNAIIPALLYQLTTGAVHIGLLRSLDSAIRSAVRGWLRLPKDCVNAYFHADVGDGGLGIPSLRWIAPLQRVNKLEILMKSSYICGPAADEFINKEKDTVIKRLTENTGVINNINKLRNRWARLLHGAYDGMALKESGKVKHQHDWVKEGTKLLSGKDYVSSCRLRINALPTRSRTTRGRVRERRCRAGCGVNETLNHITQHCHRMHGMRVKRHDAVVQYIARSLANKNFSIEVEARRQTDEGLRKPDIIAEKEGVCLILDAQIMSEQSNLDRREEQKRAKYANNISLIESVRQQYQTNNIKVVGITLNCRGVWSRKSAEELLKLKVIKENELKILSSRVVIGGLAAYNQFNSTTTTASRGISRRRRTGIG